MLPIPITDLRRKQLLTSFIGFHGSQIHYHFLSALNRSEPIPRYPLILVQPTKYPTLTAYAAVTLHLPSDLALLFDVKSFPQKDETLDLGKPIAWEPIARELLASSCSLFPFLDIILPHTQVKVNSFLRIFSVKNSGFYKRKRIQHFTFLL